MTKNRASGKARCLPLNWSPVRDSTLIGSSLTTNVRLGWKRMSVANTLAYYATAIIAVVKSFMVQTPSFQTQIFFHHKKKIVCFTFALVKS
jgi:hypothetical protein